MNVTSTGIAVALAVAVALAFMAAATPILQPFFGGAVATSTGSQATTTSMAQSPESTELPGGLIVTDTVVGSGEEAVPGSAVAVHYTGTLEDGTVFDSSIPRGEPFTFQLGAGQVIQGWDQGVAGMKVGGTRILRIPAPLAYGERAVGSIPANSTLLFEVQLLAVQ